MAPSVLSAKKANGPSTSNIINVNNSIPSTVHPSGSGFIPYKNPFGDSPQPKRKCREERKENRKIEPTRSKLSVDAYEELIKNVLNRPFKVPIPDYVPDTHGNKCLGLRRSVIRRALHDPFTCNALVLFVPPEMNENDRVKMDKSKIIVHVVVDPVVGNILRPHQREGVRFMYECVTGAKGDFNGCIMADEVI